jgi:hypothetical protein
MSVDLVRRFLIFVSQQTMDMKRSSWKAAFDQAAIVIQWAIQQSATR